MIALHECPVAKCPFRSYGYNTAYRHLMDQRQDANHRARRMTERSMPRMVKVGYNPNYLASGPPVRPSTDRDRPPGVRRDTQIRFVKLLQEDEGRPKEVTSAKKRAWPAKFERRSDHVQSPRNRRCKVHHRSIQYTWNTWNNRRQIGRKSFQRAGRHPHSKCGPSVICCPI